MVNVHRRSKVLTSIENITTTAPQDVIAAEAGFAPGLLQVVATNQLDSPNAFTLLSEGTPISPQIPLPASGVFTWDAPGGQLGLSASSGLQSSLLLAGDVQIAAYYVKHDHTTPITKEQARADTLKLRL